MHPSDHHAALREAQKALRRCQKENAALRRQLIQERKAHRSHPSAQDRHLPPRRLSKDPQKRVRARLYAQGKLARHYDRRSYLLFLADRFTDSAFFLWWSRAWAYARRIRLARTAIFVSTVILAATQTSALFVLISATYLALLPFLLMGIGLCVLISLLHARTVNRRMRTALEGRHIRVLFPSLRSSFDNRTQAFFFASARAMAAEPNTAVIVVSPHLLSPKGFGGHRMFVTARREAPHLYLVRNYYYFTLRRRILDSVDPDMSILY